MTRSQLAAVVTFVALLFAGAGHPADRQKFAITHANVAPMKQPEVFPDYTLIEARLTAAAVIYNSPTPSMALDGMDTGASKAARAARPEMRLLPPTGF